LIVPICTPLLDFLASLSKKESYWVHGLGVCFMSGTGLTQRKCSIKCLLSKRINEWLILNFLTSILITFFCSLICLIESLWMLIFTFFFFYHFNIYLHVFTLFGPHTHTHTHTYRALRQNMFWPLILQFCWENIRDNKKDIAFLQVWDKDNYTELLGFLTYTYVLEPTLVHLCQTSLLLAGPLPIVSSASLRLLYLLLYSEHIKHFQVLGFLPFP
jgi:hypothetical protein